MELGVTYIACHLPDHIEADMKHIREAHCTEVLFAMQENHLAYLTGAVRYGAGLAKAAGLRPYAVIWGFANTFGGGKSSNMLLAEPDLWRVGRDGRPIPKACLNHPNLVTRFVELADTCRSHGFEGIFVDEPHDQECYCQHCQAVFAEMFDKPLDGHESAEDYRALQVRTVAHYVAEVCRRVKGADSSQKTITCLMPNDRDCFEAVAAIAELDVLGTDPYWLLKHWNLTFEQGYADAQLVRESCRSHQKLSQLWLNCLRIPAGREPEIYSGGKTLAQLDFDAIYAWSYRGGLGTHEESERPGEAWNNLRRLYQELAQV
jgi:hypothetical protein